MSDSPRSWITLQSAELSAQIDPAGAQLSVLRDRAGRDLLWHGDASIWAGRAPVLFPIVGTLADGRYRLGSKHYALSRHGFARGKRFEVVSSTPSHALFRLRADDSTLAVYPFQFELDLAFALEGAALTVQATARNLGAERMPASLGFHPGLVWPLPFGQPRDAHYIELEKDEPAPIRRIDAAGLLAPERHPTPIASNRLRLDDALFQNDVLILDDLRSRSLRYGAETGPRIEMRFPDAKYLGIWTRPNAPFVCIEPWQGITDPQGFAGDVHDKPGIFIVPPGGTHSLTMTLVLREG